MVDVSTALLVPLTVVVGDEDLLVGRAVSAVVLAARELDQEFDVRDVAAGELQRGDLPDVLAVGDNIGQGRRGDDAVTQQAPGTAHDRVVETDGHGVGQQDQRFETVTGRATDRGQDLIPGFAHRGDERLGDGVGLRPDLRVRQDQRELPLVSAAMRPPTEPVVVKIGGGALAGGAPPSYPAAAVCAQ